MSLSHFPLAYCFLLSLFANVKARTRNSAGNSAPDVLRRFTGVRLSQYAGSALGIPKDKLKTTKHAVIQMHVGTSGDAGAVVVKETVPAVAQQRRDFGPPGSVVAPSTTSVDVVRLALAVFNGHSRADVPCACRSIRLHRPRTPQVSENADYWTANSASPPPQVIPAEAGGDDAIDAALKKNSWYHGPYVTAPSSIYVFATHWRVHECVQ